LRTTLETLKLTELTGIAGRNEHRLNAVGIYTPLQFLDASSGTLHKMVFKSVLGERWHQRLRGWEVDDVSHDMKTVGRQYVLEANNLSQTEIVQRLHHLCESVGSRLRSQNRVARGVFVYAKTYDRGYWHARKMHELPFFSDNAIYTQASLLFAGAPRHIKEIGISCYELCDDDDPQLSLFGDQVAREHRLVDAMDVINQRYGERVIHSADTLGTGRFVRQKIPFGSTRFL
jgi:nucleotidyltransferase/DNA polymerase involved in DNA repair